MWFKLSAVFLMITIISYSESNNSNLVVVQDVLVNEILNAKDSVVI